MGTAKSQTTSSLSHHLKTHPEVQKELDDKAAKANEKTVESLRDITEDVDGADIRENIYKRMNQANRAKMVQTTIPGNLSKFEKWADTHPEACKLQTLLFEMLVIDNLPWSFVEKIGFSQFISHAAPKLKIHSEKFYRDNL